MGLKWKLIPKFADRLPLHFRSLAAIALPLQSTRCSLDFVKILTKCKGWILKADLRRYLKPLRAKMRADLGKLLKKI